MVWPELSFLILCVCLCMQPYWSALKTWAVRSATITAFPTPSLSPSPHWSVPLSLSHTTSLFRPLFQEPATFVGCVVCEGEGHLNASSCLLAGPVRSRTLHSRCVRLEIPDSANCSLFPGQVGGALHPLTGIHSLPPSLHPSLSTGDSSGRSQ